MNLNYKEFNEFFLISNYIKKEKLVRRTDILISNILDFRSGVVDKREKVYEELSKIKDFLNTISNTNYITDFLKTFRVKIISYENIQSNLRIIAQEGDTDPLEETLNTVRRYCSLIISYSNYQNKLFADNKIQEADNVLVFTFDINKPVLLKNTFKKIKNISELMENSDRLCQENQQFEIIHVEDGSLAVYVTAGILVINLLDPLIDLTAKSYRHYLELTHKASIQEIERQLKEEELRHTKRMNQLEEEEKEEEKNYYDLIIKRKQKLYEKEIANAKEIFEEEIEIKKIEIKKNFPDFFKEPNNELLLNKIMRNLTEHFSQGGFAEVLKIEHEINSEEIFSKSSRELKYREALEKLPAESAQKLLELLSSPSEQPKKEKV